MVLNEEQWIKELREKRIAYGISQGRLAVASGITREYLNKIESGKMKWKSSKERAKKAQTDNQDARESFSTYTNRKKIGNYMGRNSWNTENRD